MKRYLLDTNTVSHLIKAHPNVTRNVVAVPMASLCISAITEGELQFGLAKRPDAKRLHHVVQEFLLRVDVLPWDSTVAKQYGMVRAGLEQKGKILSPLDLQIAAHAISVDAVLVSNDQAFRQIPGLMLEDWTS
jgi:tRNA(fMet)-specific endonuclease VapC